MANFFDEVIFRPCCPACSIHIKQLTDDLERLGEGFAIDNVQCLELKVCREENQQLRSILGEYGIPYG